MSVLTSRRFWVFIVAQVISIAGVILAHYFTDPFAVQMTQMGIGFVEGLAGLLIVAYTVDDTAQGVAAIKMGTHPDYPPVVDPNIVTISNPVTTYSPGVSGTNESHTSTPTQS